MTPSPVLSPCLALADALGVSWASLSRMSGTSPACESVTSAVEFYPSLLGALGCDGDGGDGS